MANPYNGAVGGAFAPYYPAPFDGAIVGAMGRIIEPPMTQDQGTRMLAYKRAQEAAKIAQAKAVGKSRSGQVVALKSPSKGTKPGAAPSNRGRTVVGGVSVPTAFKGAKASGTGSYGAMNGATPDQLAALGNYLGYGAPAPVTPAYNGASQAQIAALGGYLGYGAGAPVPTQATTQQAVANFIASPLAVTGPVSPYASMNQYQGTTGPPAISVQNSQQAAAIAARNATAEQLSSAEFRQTLNALLQEAGIAPQF